MIEDEPPRLFTLKEVAERTGFSLRTLERDCRAGRVVHVHRGRDRMMTSAQIQMLVDQHTTTPAVLMIDPRAATQQRVMRMAAREAAKRRS